MNGKQILAVVVLTCLITFISPQNSAVDWQNEALAQATKTSALAYHDEWRKLWEDHITWTRVVIMGVLDDLPGLNVYAARLLENPAEMAKALAPFYGTAAATKLSDLVSEHLLIAVDLLNAAKAGDSTALDAAKTRWYENAAEIARLMFDLNPAWPYDETLKIWTDHLDATLDESVKHLTGDFPGEVAAYDKVHTLALQMADFFSQGVIKQFHQRFAYH